MQKPIILTLDAGGTKFSFSAIRDEERLGEPFRLPSHSDDLEKCLSNLKKGFQHLIGQMDKKPAAISFAFPGPSDYKNGIIGDLPNLPAFRGGVPLGPILEDEFQIPVFINNDGDLFTYGESMAGFLPYVNGLLEEARNPKRYKNLIGVTLGTGFGVGISINGQLLQGDNSAAAEGWKFRNKRYPYSFVEDTLSIHALKRIYAEQIAIDPAKAPDPLDIFEIALKKKEGVPEAALETFLQYGEVLGDSLAHLITIFDGLVVIGGGISGAYPLFSISMMDELNGYFNLLSGEKMPRLIQHVYNLEQQGEQQRFLEPDYREIEVLLSDKKATYFEQKKSGVGLSRLGTSAAITLGAYHYALSQLT